MKINRKNGPRMGPRMFVMCFGIVLLVNALDLGFMAAAGMICIVWALLDALHMVAASYQWVNIRVEADTEKLLALVRQAELRASVAKK